MTAPGRGPAPWLFLLGALGWTWMLIGGAAFGGLTAADPLGIVLLILGGLGPVLSAAALVGLGFWDASLDRSWARFLLRCLDPRTLSLRGYLIVCGLIGVIALGPVALDPDTDLTSTYDASATFLLIGAVFGALEEPGWRGYAQEGLQRRYSVAATSLLIGLFWAVWHLPLFLVAGTYQAELGVATPAFWSFMLALVAGSVVYGWLYNRLSGVVFAAVLYHAGGNVVRELSPDADAIIALGVEVALAAVLLAAAWSWMRVSSPSATAGSSRVRSCR